MNYLRSFSLLTAGAKWADPLFALGAASFALALLGMVPLVGIVGSIATLGLAVHVQGWLAEVQRRAMCDEPGLPAAFEPTYFADGVRAVVVAIVWSLPLVAVLALAIFGLAMFDELGRDASNPIIPLVAIGAVAVPMILWWPLVQIAIVRTNLAQDWSGLAVSAVFRTLGVTLIESYVGLLVSMVMGIVITMLGFLLCVIGVYAAQPLAYATMSVVWADLYRLAVQRGAPAVTLARAQVLGVDVARTFE